MNKIFIIMDFSIEIFFIRGHKKIYIGAEKLLSKKDFLRIYGWVF